MAVTFLKDSFNGNVWRIMVRNWRGAPSKRLVPAPGFISADPVTTSIPGLPVGVEAAIKSPGIRDSAWFWVILALAVDFGAIAAAYFGRTLEVPVVLWIIAGIVLLAGLSYTRVAVRSLRLLQEGPWEIWPAAVLTVDHFAGSEGGKSSVLMLFDFRTGGRHILRVASIGQAREVVDIDGEIWFRGDPERGGVICVPGAEKPYVALPRPLFSSRDGAGLRDRFDTQWPPGNPADWPPPHEPFKRDWPGAPKGYLSDPWDN